MISQSSDFMSCILMNHPEIFEFEKDGVNVKIKTPKTFDNYKHFVNFARNGLFAGKADRNTDFFSDFPECLKAVLEGVHHLQKTRIIYFLTDKIVERFAHTKTLLESVDNKHFSEKEVDFFNSIKEVYEKSCAITSKKTNSYSIQEFIDCSKMLKSKFLVFDKKHHQYALSDFHSETLKRLKTTHPEQLKNLCTFVIGTSQLAEELDVSLEVVDSANALWENIQSMNEVKKTFEEIQKESDALKRYEALIDNFPIEGLFPFLSKHTQENLTIRKIKALLGQPGPISKLDKSTWWDQHVDTLPKGFISSLFHWKTLLELRALRAIKSS